MSSSVARIAPLEYPRVEFAAPAALTLEMREESPTFDSEPQITGVPEPEVEQRVQAAREAALVEAEERLREQSRDARHEAQQKMADALRAFEQERQAYFKRVEHEIVQLSLAIARKILEREAETDPSLVAALVRIALDRMQCESRVRIRVMPAEAERWREWAEEKGSGSQWEVIPDSALQPGDCIVETDMGTASFGFNAQLRDVEQSFLQLLAQSRAA